MKVLIQKGYEVYAIIPRGKVFEKFQKHGIKTIEYTIDRGSLNPFSAIKTILQLYNIIKKEDFSILHTFTIKPNIFGALAGKLARIPIIINHVEGLGYIYTDNTFKTKFIRMISSVLYLISFKIAKRILFLNYDDIDDLKNIIKKEKTRVIKGTGIDINHFSLQNIDKRIIDTLKKNISMTKETVVITFIARLLWHKGIKEFVEAADILKLKFDHLLFLIVGWLDRENPATVPDDFIEKAQENRSIRFLGEREDIREILAITDIYTLPSYREGTPRTVLEAMAMSKPIVTTDVPGCRQTVEDGVNGYLVPPKDSLSLAQTLEKLILNRILREEMGKASRVKVVREFSDEVVITQILQLYEELLTAGIK